MDLTQRDCAELPKVQTFCMCIYLSNDCWQSAQELLLDVGAALILKPTKPEGVSVRLVTTAEKKKTAHSLERQTAMACHGALKSLLINLIKPLLLFSVFTFFVSWPLCIVFLSC